MKENISLTIYPILPVDRIPCCFNSGKLKVLIYGTDVIAHNLLEKMSKFPHAPFIGFVDENPVRTNENPVVYRLHDISHLIFDYVIISSYCRQEEICMILEEHHVSASKIIKLKKQDFEERCTLYEFDTSYSKIRETLHWYRGNYKERCLFGDQDLSDLLLLDLDFSERDVLYHIIEQDFRYIGSISRKGIGRLGNDAKFSNIKLSEICARLSEIESIDKGVSVDTTIGDIN